MKKKTLGYRNGFVYFIRNGEVWRADYADNTTARWYCSLHAMGTSIKAYGPLCNDEGEEIDIMPMIKTAQRNLNARVRRDIIREVYGTSYAAAKRDMGI